MKRTFPIVNLGVNDSPFTSYSLYMCMHDALIQAELTMDNLPNFSCEYLHASLNRSILQIHEASYSLQCLLWCLESTAFEFLSLVSLNVVWGVV